MGMRSTWRVLAALGAVFGTVLPPMPASAQSGMAPALPGIRQGIQGVPAAATVRLVRGEGKSLRIDSVEPRTVTIPALPPTTSVSIVVNYTVFAGELQAGNTGSLSRNCLRADGAPGAGPGSYRCTLTFDVSSLKTGDKLAFNFFVLAKGALLPGPSDTTYLVEIPVVRQQPLQDQLKAAPAGGADRPAGVPQGLPPSLPSSGQSPVPAQVQLGQAPTPVPLPSGGVPPPQLPAPMAPGVRDGLQSAPQVPGAPPAVGQAPGAQLSVRVPRPLPLAKSTRLVNPQLARPASRFQESVRQQNETALRLSTSSVDTDNLEEYMYDTGRASGEVERVNGQRPAGFVMRPGQAVTIVGKGFGNNGGKVRLLGAFRTSVIELRVLAWRRGVVYARLDDSISGEEDLDDVRLEVHPNGRQPFAATGLTFEAAREAQLLTDMPRRYVTFVGQLAAYGTAGTRPGVYTYDHNASFVSAVPARTAIVSRATSGVDLDWFPPGTDTYALPLRTGFEIESVEFWAGRTDQNPNECDGADGGQYLQGQYGYRIESANVLRVDWAVWRCHRSPFTAGLGLMRVKHPDVNTSAYALDVYVVGPRGLPALR